MMKRTISYMAVFIIVVLFVAGISSAVTYTDADGDGIYEVGEVITFYGDDSYVDTEGVEHNYTNWSWDFDSDGIIDAYGKEVNHTYDEKGTYQITVYEIGDINIKTELTIKIRIPFVEKPEPTFKEVLNGAINDTDELIENSSLENDKLPFDRMNLKCANRFLKWALRKEGTWKWLPLMAVKFAVKNLEKVNERGARNTSKISSNLSHGVKNKVKKAINESEMKYGPANYKVLKAWENFNNGLLKIEEGRYSKAIEEFYKAYWAL